AARWPGSWRSALSDNATAIAPANGGAARLLGALAQGDVAHETGIVSGRQPAGLRPDSRQHVGERVEFGLGVIAQDISCHAVLVAGMPDPDSHTAEIGAKITVDGA